MKTIQEILTSVDLQTADSNKEKFEKLFLSGEFENNYELTEYLYNNFSKEELSFMFANLYVELLQKQLNLWKQLKIYRQQ